MSDIKIAIDLDGVLVNCAQGVSETLGAKDKFNEAPKNNFCSRFGVARRELEERCFNQEGFWLSLTPYSWAYDLINYVDYATDNWVILTKCPQNKSAVFGKFKWFQGYFPEHTQRLRICFGKKDLDCCGPKSLLIDDYLKNIDAWRKKGGSTFWWEELLDDATGKKSAAERIYILAEEINFIKYRK